MTRNIVQDNKVIAVVLDGELSDGTKPLTDDNWALQIVGLKHPKDKVLVAHAHKPTERITQSLMEALVVFSGLVEATIYYGGKVVDTVQLKGGQTLLLVEAGIGIRVLKDAQMLEFKNGPFIEDKIVYE